MFDLMIKSNPMIPVDQDPDVQTALQHLLKARREQTLTEEQVNSLRQRADSYVGQGMSVSWIEQLEAQTSLPLAVQRLVQVKKGLQSAADNYQTTRQAAIETRLPELRDKLEVAVKIRDEKMWEAKHANDEVVQVIEEANRLLGPRQKEIPNAGLPFFQVNNGGESKWDYQRRWVNGHVLGKLPQD